MFLQFLMLLVLKIYAGANEIKAISNSQIVSSAEVSENEKQPEQFYRIKTGKCYIFRISSFNFIVY